MRNDEFIGKSKSAIDILGNRLHYECMGCAILNGDINVPGGIVYDGEYAMLTADSEIPIPGFLIVNVKRHIKSFSELEKEERIEIANIITYAERAIKSLNIGKEIILVQEEKSDHLHVWIFPYYEWMEKEYGFGTTHLRDIMKYVKNNNKYSVNDVLNIIEKVREYFNEHDINL